MFILRNASRRLGKAAHSRRILALNALRNDIVDTLGELPDPVNWAALILRLHQWNHAAEVALFGLGDGQAESFGFGAAAGLDGFGDVADADERGVHASRWSRGR